MIIDLRQLVLEELEVKAGREKSKLYKPLPGGYTLGWKPDYSRDLLRLVTGQLARAEQQPKGLLQDLGVALAQGSTKAQVAYSLLSQAVKNEIFGQYFKDLVYDKENDVTTIKPAQDVQGSAPDRYVEAILAAAFNAGLAAEQYDGSSERSRLKRDIVHIQDGRVMIYDRKTIGKQAKAAEKPEKTSEETTPEAK